jgi:hypothetical protein
MQVIKSRLSKLALFLNVFYWKSLIDRDKCVTMALINSRADPAERS